MRKFILIVFIIFYSALGYGQSATTKANKIYSFYKSDKLTATDSVIKMLPNDKWFQSLAIKDQNFRVNRIKFYRNLCVKKPKNLVYLKGWTLRALK